MYGIINSLNVCSKIPGLWGEFGGICVCWQKRFIMTIKRAALYEKCYHILGLNESADQTEVRKAYIELVKKYHPDSGTAEASDERFQEVDEAFKLLQEKFAKSRRGIVEDEEEEVFDIRHTAPQHRQYLSFDGMGVGNPFQREKQYQQIKAMKAQERVLNHRLEKSRADEKSVMKKGSFYKKHAIKTKYGFERVVEDLIQEAMSKGDFNNLTGTGKPLTSAQGQNPYLDFTTHKLNKILQDNGFTPEWITLQREIRDAIKNLKNRMREERAFYGDYPLVGQEAADWEAIVNRFETDVRQINKSIDKYNLIVPLLDKQFFRLKLNNISHHILTDPNALKNFKRPVGGQSEQPEAAPAQRRDFLSLLSSLF